jgi:hypothetical protein
MADIFDEVAKRDIFDDVESIGGSMPTSTITGKPLPTDAEKMSMSKQAMGEILPIAGDIAGTAIAPQLKLAASAPRIARAGAGLINMLSRAAGSTAGSVTGETLRQVMTQNFDPNQIYIQGAAGAAGEIGTSAAAPLLKAVRKPGLELASDLTLSGSKLKQYFTERLKKQANERIERFVADVAPESVKGKISEVGLARAVDEAVDEKQAIYGHFKEGLEAVAEKNNGHVPLEGTAGALQQWLKEELPKHKSQAQAENAIIKAMGFSPGGQKEFQHVSIRRLLRGEDLSDKEVNYLLGNIFEKSTDKFLKMHPEITELRGLLKDAIVKDLDDLGAGAAKKTADEMHRALKNFQRIESIYKSAAPANKETGERMFNPLTFAENVYRNERAIRTTMPDVWPQIKAEADAMKGVADDISTGKRSMGGLPMLAGLASSHFTGYIPVGEAFGAASAWALMTPSGKAALSGVFKYGVKPAAKAGLHIGGRLVEMGKSH